MNPVELFEIGITPPFSEWEKGNHLTTKLHSKMKNKYEEPGYIENLLFGKGQEGAIRADLKLPAQEINFYSFTVWEDAKEIDDFMLSIEINPTFGFFLSERAKQVLDDFTLPNHTYYPVEVFYRKKSIQYYYLLITQEQPSIEFSACQFEDWFDDTSSPTFQSYQEWIDRVYKKDGDTELFLDSKKIAFKEEVDFYANLTTNGKYFYCAKKLRDSIQKAKLTGIEFHNHDEIKFFLQ